MKGDHSPMNVAYEPRYCPADHGVCDKCSPGEMCAKMPAAPMVDPFRPYPDGNPKTAMGMKKPSLDAVPPVALFEIGKAMADGKRKYGAANWRQQPITASTYLNAMARHLFAWWDGQDKAEDSGCHHLAHVAACCSIILDSIHHGVITDDRPTPGPLPQFLVDETKK